jgi:catechol 2,3-dioxygenase-like lactoylglutathione lyase family enzyme
MPSFLSAAATLPAKDLDATRKFYEGVLGLIVEEENPGGIRYRVGSSDLFLYPSEFAGTNQGTAAGFEVSGLEGIMAELREAGVAFEEYDMPGLKTENGIAEMPGERGAWFKDPEGNILSLLERRT